MQDFKSFYERAAEVDARIEYEPLYDDDLLVDDHGEPHIPFAV